MKLRDFSPFRTTFSTGIAKRNARSHSRLGIVALAAMLTLSAVAPPAIPAFADAEDDFPQGVGGLSGLDVTIQSVDQLTGLTAIAFGGNENVNLRAEPTTQSDILVKIPSGATVNLRVDRLDTVTDASDIRWWPASYGGLDGWISGAFLVQATTTAGDIISSTVVPFDYTRQATAHSTAQVFGNGSNVNVRAEPSLESDIVARAIDGQVISLRIALVDTVYDADGRRWWPVTVVGIPGWISGFHLLDSNDAPTTSGGFELEEPGSTSAVIPEITTDTPPEMVSNADGDTGTVPDSAESGTGWAAGDFVQVFTGDGTRVNIRSASSLSGEIVGQLDDLQIVTVKAGPFADSLTTSTWYEITTGSQTGFVDAMFLITSVEGPGTEPVSTPPAQTESTSGLQPQPGASEGPATGQQASSSMFIYPIENYRRTQGFGCSSLPFYSYNAEWGCALHDGLDLAAPSGTPLLAAAAGTVVQSGWCNCGLGYYVEINHGNGIHTIYGHMRAQPIVSVGQQVSQGQRIGEVGSTGISTGPHVHFMVKVNGVARNPENYLP